MLQSSELMLLITVCDAVSTPITKFPENLYETLDSLVQKDLVKISKNTVYPSKKGRMLIRSAKLENRFRRILPMMNFRMIANLWHRLIEYCTNSGFHLNVVLKNITEESFSYIEKEIEIAKASRNKIVNIKKIVNAN